MHRPEIASQCCWLKTNYSLSQNSLGNVRELNHSSQERFSAEILNQIPATYLDEANIKRLLTEALTADVKPVFPDQTGLVGADAAV